MGDTRISCRDCGEDFTKHPQLLASGGPCPSCGGHDRHVEVSDRVTAHAKVALVARDAAGRWFAKVKAGDEFFHLTQSWHQLFRRIDRDADRYTERITDAETGEVIKSVEEPLSEHQGHGSAKTIRPSKTYLAPTRKTSTLTCCYTPVTVQVTTVGVVGSKSK
jgi:predicted  nucleic acid-binding Zn-ribbon protein